MLDVPAQLGYPVLFALVRAESAGATVPGETALLSAGVLAGAGRLSLTLVIGVAVAAAVTGDGISRRGGRRRHGAKSACLGRFFPGVRVVAAVLASASAMSWPRFALFDITGGFVWAERS